MKKIQQPLLAAAVSRSSAAAAGSSRTGGCPWVSLVRKSAVGRALVALLSFRSRYGLVSDQIHSGKFMSTGPVSLNPSPRTLPPARYPRSSSRFSPDPDQDQMLAEEDDFART